MKQLSLRFFLAAISALIFASCPLFLSGCDKDKVSQKKQNQSVASKEINASIPAGNGMPIFTLQTNGTPQIELKRENQKWEGKISTGFSFLENDTVKNLSKSEIVISSTENVCRFSIESQAELVLRKGEMSINHGAVRMDFRKINGRYAIRLPIATLGIRGTKLTANVMSPEKSKVALYEGSIALEPNGGAPKTMQPGTEFTMMKVGAEVQLQEGPIELESSTQSTGEFRSLSLQMRSFDLFKDAPQN
ncbi:MAG: hypothetical protein HQM08_28625 [Candidatus Riflebacteria bacterium]|nr:hypothetical protein [Candidatus Riflebacteria bacterium]